MDMNCIENSPLGLGAKQPQLFMNFPSKLIENAVNEVSKLPGIGKKSALRVILYLLKQEEKSTENLSVALQTLRKEIKYCKKCYNISDDEICSICASKSRDNTILCIVESFKDIFAIENTAQFRGVYHVLGGLISPMDGIAPEDLHLDSITERIKELGVKEVLLAVSPTMEGDTTAFYITKKLKELNLKITTLARGVPVGGELEYTDEITLGRSILSRINYD